MWAFLGNGYTEAQVNRDVTKLTPSVRLKDQDPWYID